jgi:GTP-binding protein
MSRPPYQQAKFLMSAAALDGLPPDTGIEVAFVGRSNAGKSTALNMLCGQHRLARTSNTPGRTQLINIFTLDDSRRLIDLPGYGYAKAPKHIQATWQDLIDGYLQARDCIRGLVLLMDIRHPLEPIDKQLLAWTAQCNIPVLVLLSKADKLKYGQAKNTLLKVRSEIIHPDATVMLFSSLAKQGIEEAQDKLDQWFEISPKN